MKRLYLCIFLVVLITIIDGKCHRKNKIVSVSNGVSFGKCGGYCRRSINITVNPRKLIALKEPNYDQAEYPVVTKENSFSSQQWQALLGLINSKGFRALDDRIGCPDCADGGAEWIQINWPDINKRVTFEYGKLIEGFEGLINQLRNLKQQYADNL